MKGINEAIKRMEDYPKELEKRINEEFQKYIFGTEVY